MNDANAALSDSASIAGKMDENPFAHSLEERERALDAEAMQNGKDDHLHQILAVVVAFRDGDFTVRLPLSWPGIEGRIAEALNQTISHEARITEEVTRLSVTVGKEGRLKQRLSLPSATGGWARPGRRSPC